MIVDDVMDVLEYEGYGTVGEDIFSNFMIDEPNNQIVVYQLPGFPFTPKMMDVKYSFSISLRNTDFEYALRTINSIANTFDNGETRYKIAPSGRKMICSVATAPVTVRIDESNRILCTVGIHIITVRD